MNQRDWKLAQLVPDILDTVCGLAHATLVVLKPGRDIKARDHHRIELAKEMGGRYVELVTNLSVASMEYHDGMDEAALHAWAKRVVATIEKSPE